MEGAQRMIESIAEERSKRLDELAGRDHVTAQHELLVASFVIEPDPKPLFDQVRETLTPKMFALFQRLCVRVSADELAERRAALKKRRGQLIQLAQKHRLQIALATSVADALLAALADIERYSSSELMLLERRGRVLHRARRRRTRPQRPKRLRGRRAGRPKRARGNWTGRPRVECHLARRRRVTSVLANVHRPACVRHRSCRRPARQQSEAVAAAGHPDKQRGAAARRGRALLLAGRGDEPSRRPLCGRHTRNEDLLELNSFRSVQRPDQYAVAVLALVALERVVLMPLAVSARSASSPLRLTSTNTAMSPGSVPASTRSSTRAVSNSSSSAGAAEYVELGRFAYLQRLGLFTGGSQVRRPRRCR